MRDEDIGIDLHQAFFQACAVDGAGERLWEGRFPRTAAGLEALRARCTPTCALAVEASTPTWHFADAVVVAVGELRIVDAAKTKLKAVCGEDRPPRRAPVSRRVTARQRGGHLLSAGGDS